MSVFKKGVYTLLILSLFLACSEEKKPTLFENIEADRTGISFKNQLKDEEGFDVFRYRNYYNGAGVGIGDINNDGLPDIYFVSNQESNKLYLNKGNFKFEDITKSAKAGGTKPWSTGVTIADINGDGWLDIYVSNSGDIEGGNRANELFINNRDSTFSEQAEAFGLADSSFSTHAAFFDYDQDGDLDCYVLNNSFRPVSSLPLKNLRENRDTYGGDKLFENRKGKFVDISEEAGIFGSVIGFGLGVTLLDANSDGWTDIYISNDFFERDYLYVNQQGKKFSEELENYFDQTSLASMGADAADLNNDGLPEIFVTEMLPENNTRLKQMTSFESKNIFEYKRKQDFYNQFQRNTLQMNFGSGMFSEIGRYANVNATDWSWGTLLFDMDNDSYKEIFVTNGVYKDVTDQDFLQYFGSEENLKAAREGKETKFSEFIEKMPSTPLPNYAYTLDSAMTYKNMADRWGFDTPTFSNGAAYGDLDNDGDLDLVINNLNQESFVYKNTSETLTENHYLSLSIKGPEKNTSGIGTKLTGYVKNKRITKFVYPSNGFQSSVDHGLVMGLGKAKALDSLDIQWDHDRISRYYDVRADTQLTISYNEETFIRPDYTQPSPIFSKIDLEHTHRENNDQSGQPRNLPYHELSAQGPALAKSDLNKDGLDDFFIGGAAGQPGTIFMNNGDNTFREVVVPEFENHKLTEDVAAAFFDADGDGDEDLYVVSGGDDFRNNPSAYSDRLYLFEEVNGGTPLLKTSGNLPGIRTSGSCVKPADYDGDGDIDLFVGSRSIPGQYGRPANSYLLENDGTGTFKDVTSTYISQLHELGMVTDAAWADYDSDNDLDLIIVGEWMPIVLFENRGNFFQRQFKVEGLTYTEGWWNIIYPYDINNDGRMDFIAGNLGTNSMFKASSRKPVRLFINDFDKNGSLDHIYTFKKDNEFIPYHLRDDLVQQLPFLKTKFPKYEDYANKSVKEIFSEEELNGSIQLSAYYMASALIINKGNGKFELEKLPAEAQFSPVVAVGVDDYDGDGANEIVLAGNFFGTRPEEGYYDANHGLLYEIHEGKNSHWEMINPVITGMNIRGAVKNLVMLQSKNNKLLVIGKNDGPTEIYAY